jgi:hypothetical protein
MLRDPRDVGRSSIGMGWAGNSYYGIDHWLFSEREWDEAAPDLRPTNVMELRYEALFHDIDPELHRVCAFIGVPWKARQRHDRNAAGADHGQGDERQRSAGVLDRLTGRTGQAGHRMGRKA